MLRHAATLGTLVIGELLLVLGSTGIMTLVGAATVAGGLAIEVTAWRRLKRAHAIKPSHG
jgi:hypothetical protein